MQFVVTRGPAPYDSLRVSAGSGAPGTDAPAEVEHRDAVLETATSNATVYTSSRIKGVAEETAPWPRLMLAEWADTCATVHMWTQVVGKIRLALAPYANHWWQVPLYVNTRGLTTSPIPWRQGDLEIAFDFIDHQLRIDTTDGRRRLIDLKPQTVAEFYRRVMAALDDLGISVRIWPMPVEIPSPIRFDRDDVHASYDAAAAHRWWQALLRADAVLQEFRGRFIGKVSPVHFFWGSFDLAVTRFSGRRAPEREGADAITREAYSHEVISAGFWPGAPGIVDAAFYAYAAPEPDGFKTAPVDPEAAFYSRDFNEFLLPYEAVRTAASPRDTLMAFLQTTYEAGATLAGWNRAELEKPVPPNQR